MCIMELGGKSLYVIAGSPLNVRSEQKLVRHSHSSTVMSVESDQTN